MQSEQSDMNWTPVRVFGEERQTRWLVICDHATNTVPAWLNGGTLGLSDADMQRHIAYDVGAAGTSLRLAERLDATVIMADYSRLIIDPNRGLDDPTLVRRLSDGTIVPANRDMTGEDLERRIAACYTPYHDELARLAARRADTVIVSIHSFTPRLLNSAPRPWHIGLLFAQDARLSLPLIEILRQDGKTVVGVNEPYPGYLAGDTIDQHATRKGRHNTLVELRSDLIETDAGQTAWAERLADALPNALRLAER